ncbi:MAG: hypothetical protein GX893_06020 [Firmicutes bacterium]|nr:hypothetical protein [Bacillota bacterium]
MEKYVEISRKLLSKKMRLWQQLLLMVAKSRVMQRNLKCKEALLIFLGCKADIPEINWKIC